MKIAVENNTTIDEIRSEITKAIDAGMNDPDQKIQQRWKAMSKTNGTPTPEEAIVYLSREAKKNIPDFQK